MSNYNPAGGGLQYRGTAANQPPNCIFDNRSPTIYDTQGVSLLDFWLNTVTGQVYALVSLTGNAQARRSLATWALVGSSSGDLITLTGDTGGTVSANSQGNITISGGGGPIVVTGSPSTNLLTVSIAVATTTSQGTVQLSSNANSIAGTDTGTSVTPASLAAKLGTQTLNGIAYGNTTSGAVLWTAQGASGTLLTGTGGAPAFSAHPTVTEITITGTVTNPTDAATKEYVDAVSAGFSFIASVRLATAATLGTVTYANGAAGVGATLTNNGTQAALVVDGVAVSGSDRILVKNQTSQFQNGIYTVTTVGSGATNWVLTRAADYDQAPAEIKPGNIVPVTEGNTNANTLWLQTATVTTIGTDSIIFVPFGIEPISPLPIAQGGTNATSFSTTDGVVYFDGTRLVTTSAGTTGQVLTSNGPGVAPTYQASSGAGNVITTFYNTPGSFTWTKNASTQSVEVYGFGGGGGGAYGAGGVGSGGGGGGGCFYYFVPISVLNSPVSGVVGAGGAGGTVSSSAGGNGQPSSFGNFTTGGFPVDSYIGGSPLSGGGAPGGNGGAGGFIMTMTNSLGVTFLSGGVRTLNSGSSGSSSPINNSYGSMLPTGGGGSNGAGGSILHPVTSAVIVAGGTAGTSMSPSGGSGNTAGASANLIVGGTGGGGGFGTGAGGNGGALGGGGGAGGSGGGNGGSGGNGLVIVIEYT